MRNFLYTRVFELGGHGFTTSSATTTEASKLAYSFNIRAKELMLQEEVYFKHLPHTTLVACESLNHLDSKAAWQLFVDTCKSKLYLRKGHSQGSVSLHRRVFEFIDGKYCSRATNVRQTVKLKMNWNRKLVSFGLDNKMQFVSHNENCSIQLVSLEEGKQPEQMHALWLAALAKEKQDRAKNKVANNTTPVISIAREENATMTTDEEFGINEELSSRLAAVQSVLDNTDDLQLDAENLVFEDDSELPLLLRYFSSNEQDCLNGSKDSIDQMFENFLAGSPEYRRSPF